MYTPNPVAIASIGAELGEGPAWDCSRQCLWFVDIKRQRLYCHEPRTAGTSHWQAPGQIGWVVPAADGSLITGLRGGLYRFLPDRGTFSLLRVVEADVPGNRLNDATTDAAGAIWFGSMDDTEQAHSGRIYRTAAGTIVDSGLAAVCITNGPALSPDGRSLYHTDTLGRRILVSRLGGDGLPHATQLFAAIEAAAGYPDGPTVDSEGFVWTGLFAGWAARRYAPDGRLVQVVRLPVANVTKLAFGGADLRTAFVTTARKGLTAAQLAQQPHAGDLFSFRVEAPGLPLTPAQWPGPAAT